jgi:hypothetical protein
MNPPVAAGTGCQPILGYDQPPTLPTITVMELATGGLIADLTKWMSAQIILAQEAIDIQLGPPLLAYTAQGGSFHSLRADRSSGHRLLPSA